MMGRDTGSMFDTVCKILRATIRGNMKTKAAVDSQLRKILATEEYSFRPRNLYCH